MINGHVATALWKSEISWKSDSWFVCARVMSSHFLIPPPNYNIKAHKRGDFHQIESYGPNTVGHKSNGIPEWESRKLRWFFFTFIHVVPFTFIHLGPGTWYFLSPVLSLLCLSSPSPLLLLPSIASVIIMVKVEMVKGGKWENDKSDSHNA